MRGKGDEKKGVTTYKEDESRSKTSPKERRVQRQDVRRRGESVVDSETDVFFEGRAGSVLWL
jgi:hypothetical protein